MNTISTIVPSADVPHVSALCAQVVPSTSPVRVRCEPEMFAPHNECFEVVAKRVVELGGEQVIGWAIWEFPDAYIEAELHCVWRSPAGALVDITPRPAQFDAILFLPDPARVDDGRTIDNVRVALTKNNDVKRFLFLCGQRYRILNAGDRAMQRQISLPRRELKCLHDTEKEIGRLRNRLAKRFLSGGPKLTG